MTLALRHWLLHKPRQAMLCALLLALGIGFFTAHLYQSLVEQDFQTLLDGQAQREAARLEMETMRGQAMGVASLFGLNEPLLKELALGKRDSNNPEGLARMKPARIMLGADGIYVMDDRGKIVAHETDHDLSVGKNIKFRPYWQQAMAGKENVYPAVGSKSGERGIYVADAIRAGTSRNDPVIGTVVIKLLGEQLDQRLTSFGVKALLLAPQGVVFASTEPEWLFAIHGTPTPERIEAITRLNQFGKAYESGGTPQILPFDLQESEIHIGNRRHARSMAQVHWNDPAGSWSLVLLGDLQHTTPISVMVTIGLSAGMGLFFLQLVALRAYREGYARRDAVAKTQEAAEKLVAEARIKSRHAEFGACMQQARNLSGLTQAWFKQLSDFLPMHQAALYVLDSGELSDGTESLILAGFYGDDRAPGRIGLGEGLIGQCAVDRQPLSFELPPQGYWRIGSGLGEAPPRRLFFLPVMRSERLLGVLEFASLDPDFLDHRPVIEEMLPLLAANLEIVLIAKRTEETLAEAHRVEGWLLGVLDGIPFPVVVPDAQGWIQLANQAAVATFGEDLRQPGGVPLARLLPQGLGNPADVTWAARRDGSTFQTRLAAFQVPPHPRFASGAGVIFSPVAS
ncbi:MAG: GAF domain-containing protein [Magnetococcales bacterium]|nr:GAF domain-containing protein [Magnetococcales bacterium]